MPRDRAISVMGRAWACCRGVTEEQAPLGRGWREHRPVHRLRPAQKTPNPDGRGESSSHELFSSAWQCFIVKKAVLARNVTTLFSIKKHFPLKNRHKFEASVKAPSQSVVTMASFSSSEASGEISTSACMVLIKADKQSQDGLSRKPCGEFVPLTKEHGIHGSWGGTCVNTAALG